MGVQWDRAQRAFDRPLLCLVSPRPPSASCSNRVTGIYELSLCHVADAGSPGRPLPCSLCWGRHFVREPGFPGVTQVASAKLLFWGALPFETHVLTCGLAGLS